MIFACERDMDDVSSVHSESCLGETEEFSREVTSCGACCHWRVQQTMREEGDSAAPIHQQTFWYWLEEFPGARTVSVSWNVREGENEVRIRCQDRQRAMRVSQRCAHEFSQRSVAIVVVSQNLCSQIRVKQSGTEEP